MDIPHSDEINQTDTFFLQSKTHVITLATNLDDWLKKNVVSTIMSTVDSLQENGSGWALLEIRGMDVTYNKHSGFNANSYVPLPATIKNKHAIVNVKNEDEMCFVWAILSALFSATSHVDRVSNYKQYEHELNLENIKFPVSISDIDLFEKNNP